MQFEQILALIEVVKKRAILVIFVKDRWFSDIKTIIKMIYKKGIY